MTGSGNLKKRAMAGETDAMYDLGTEFEAKGNLKRARDWYEKAAALDDAAAVRALGVLEQFHGAGPEAARPFYERAAGLGDGQAMNNLGLMLCEEGDLKRGRKLLRDASSSGYDDALFNLGIVALGAGEPEEAKGWMQKAVDKGVVRALWGLGVIAKDEGDLVAARRYADAAVEEGSADGMSLSAELYATSGELIRAKRMYAKAAEHGNTDALFQLGLIEQQAGALEQARAWYEKAVESGEDRALSNLGLVLDAQGDASGARRRFEEAADAGHVEGLVNLGALLHRQGDDKAARGAYERAVEAGSTEAMTNLGLMASAAGDVVTAEDWWQRAAALGDMNALFQLGLLEQRERKVRRGVPRGQATKKKGLSVFVSPGLLDGYEFVFTGRLESMTRKQAQRQVREHGGRVSERVSGDTSFVVVGGAAGVKALLGEMSDAYVIDEETFLKILRDGVDVIDPASSEVVGEPDQTPAADVRASSAAETDSSSGDQTEERRNLKRGASSGLDATEIDARIAAGGKEDLVALIEAPGVVAQLTPEQQVALAEHRSVDVPRALAKHAPDLSPETIRVLAKSRIFTARRNLARSGGADLPADVLELLADDEDDVVRKTIAAVWTPDPAKPSAEASKRRVEKEERVSGIASAASLDEEEIARIIKAGKRDELIALVDNAQLLAQCSDEQQVQIARHRSVEVPRALARHASMLCPEAVRAIAESRIYTARRALVRFAGATLPQDVRDLLRDDDDEVVRKLVADIGGEQAERAETSAAHDLDERALKKAAKDGDAAAMATLGLHAWEAGDMRAAKSWLAKAAKAGDVVSMLDLESIAMDEGDKAVARTWLQAAAIAGHPSAASRWGAIEQREQLAAARKEAKREKSKRAKREQGAEPPPPAETGVVVPAGEIAFAALEDISAAPRYLRVPARKAKAADKTRYVVNTLAPSIRNGDPAAYLVRLAGIAAPTKSAPEKLTPIGSVGTDTATLVVLDPACDFSGFDHVDVYERAIYGDLTELGLAGKVEILQGFVDGEYAVYGVGRKPFAQFLVVMTIDPLALTAFVFPPEDAAANCYADYLLFAWSVYAKRMGAPYLRRFAKELSGDWPVGEDAATRDMTADQFAEMVEILASVGHPAALREAGKLEIENNDDLTAARRLWKKAAAKGDSEAARLIVDGPTTGRTGSVRGSSKKPSKAKPASAKAGRDLLQLVCTNCLKYGEGPRCESCGGEQFARKAELEPYDRLWVWVQNEGDEIIGRFVMDVCDWDKVSDDELGSVATWKRFLAYLTEQGESLRLPDGTQLDSPSFIKRHLDEELFERAELLRSID